MSDQATSTQQIRLDGGVFAPGTAEITWLTTGEDFADYRPVFSPDGRAVLFERTPAGGGNTTLYILRLDGGEPEPFLEDVPPGITDQTRADWHAGSGGVVFCGNGGPLCLANGDGTGAQVISGTEGMIYPSWFANGEEMAVMMTGKAPYTGRVDRAGNLLGRMSPDDLYAGMPSISQQNPAILAFPGQPAVPPYNQSNNRIYIGTDAKTARLLDGKQGRAPWWSPDGRVLAFESDRAPSGQYAVYVSTPDGSCQQQLTDPRYGAQHPKFSPDGKTIVLAARPGAGLQKAIGTIPCTF